MPTVCSASRLPPMRLHPMKNAFIRLGFLVALLIVSSVSLHPQDQNYAKAHYTKYEYAVPMRDGTKLFTSVYVPKDRSQPYPVMLTRTPYNVAPYGTENYKTSLGPSDLLSLIHISEPTRLGMISYAVFCLKKKN